MMPRPSPIRRPAGFTMIELLVAVTVSVVLLSILAFVFSFSTMATQNANARIAMTSRTRSLQIRMRQEIGNFLPTARLAVKGANAGQTWEIDPAGKWIIFSTATDEDGHAVNVDVKYEYKAGMQAVDGALFRRRDKTGPYKLDANGQVMIDPKTSTPTDPRPLDNGPAYILGDDQFFQDGVAAESSAPSTAMLTNVRKVVFTVIDPPNFADPTMATQLNPRTTPAAIQMEIQYGPEKGYGNTEDLQDVKIVFPIYRGL